MEFASSLSGHWLEIGVAVYLIGMMLYGHAKGAIRLAVSAAAMIITLLAVRIAMPGVVDWLKKDTPVYERLQERLEASLSLEELLAAAGMDAAEKSEERSVIEALELPEQVKELLLENNNGEVYHMMGVERFRDYILGYLADMLLRIVVFILLFLLVFLLLRIAVAALDLIARLPILSGLNQIAGAVLGLAVGVIYIWVLCLAITVFSRTGAGSWILNQINESLWLSWLYDHNLLVYFILGLIRSVI